MLINLLFKGPTALNGAADEFGVISGAAFLGEMIGQMLHLI